MTSVAVRPRAPGRGYRGHQVVGDFGLDNRGDQLHGSPPLLEHAYDQAQPRGRGGPGPKVSRRRFNSPEGTGAPRPGQSRSCRAGSGGARRLTLADEHYGEMGAVDKAGGPGSVRLMEAAALEALFASLDEAGYRVIGPTARDGAIVLDELAAVGELPFGWGVQLEPGGYRLRRRSDSAAFGHSAGPGSWKQFLHPPREKLWSVSLADGGFEAEASDAAPPRLAFFGVRPCDLRAISIQNQ